MGMRPYSRLLHDPADRDREIRIMADHITRYADDMAEVLGFDLSGYQDKSAGLMANLAMDWADGRLLLNPVSAVMSKIDAAENKGVRIPIDQQDEMAAKALSVYPFWRGYHSARTWTVFWSMLCWHCRPVYSTMEWFDRMREINAAVQEDGFCRAAYERVETAANALKEADATGTDQETFDAFVAYLAAREAFYDVHDAAVRVLDVDPDKVHVETDYIEKVRALGDIDGPACFQMYVDNDMGCMLSLENHTYTRASVLKALREVQGKPVDEL